MVIEGAADTELEREEIIGSFVGMAWNKQTVNRSEWKGWKDRE